MVSLNNNFGKQNIELIEPPMDLITAMDTYKTIIKDMADINIEMARKPIKNWRKKKFYE